jgi:hypothetical protein
MKFSLKKEAHLITLLTVAPFVLGLLLGLGIWIWKYVLQY